MKPQNAANGLEIAIQLPFNVHRTNMADICIDLMKSILVQRNQIPLQYEKLAEQVHHHEKSISNKLTTKSAIHDVTNTYSLRKAKQLEKIEARKIKNQDKFLKKAAIFISGCDQLMKCLREKINKDGDSIASVRIILGATPMSAKAMYKIIFPDTLTKFPIDNFKSGTFLFRSMVTNEHLVDINRTRLPATNMFLFIEMKGSQHLDACSFLPSTEPKEPNRRCKPVTIKILPRRNGEVVTTSNGVKNTPLFAKLPSRPQGQDSYSQICMDMCTPQVPSNNKHVSLTNHSSTIYQRQQRTSECSNGYPMPNGCSSLLRKRHFSVGTTSTPNGSEVIMDVCTPVIMNGRGSMELCTPATRTKYIRNCLIPRNGSFESHTKLSKDLCNNLVESTSNSRESMELCTPNTLPLPPPLLHSLSTPAASTNSFDLNSTPATKRVRHYSMELCTPHVARPTAVAKSSTLDLKVSSLSLHDDCDMNVSTEKETVWLTWAVGVKGLQMKGY